MRMPQRFYTGLQRLAILVVAAVLLWMQARAVLLFLQHDWMAVRFPYPLDYGEGPLLDQIVRLAHFENIYRVDLTVPPYTVANYPPLFLLAQVPWHLLSGALWFICVAFSNLAASIWFSLKPLVDPLVGLATATLLVQLTRSSVSGQRSRALSLLESRPLVGLGHFSYSLYLTHLPVLAVIYFALRPLGFSASTLSLVLLAAGALSSLVVAYAFHVAIERRFIAKR